MGKARWGGGGRGGSASARLPTTTPAVPWGLKTFPSLPSPPYITKLEDRRGEKASPRQPPFLPPFLPTPSVPFCIQAQFASYLHTHTFCLSPSSLLHSFPLSLSRQSYASFLFFLCSCLLGEGGGEEEEDEDGRKEEAPLHSSLPPSFFFLPSFFLPSASPSPFHLGRVCVCTTLPPSTSAHSASRAGKGAGY